MKKNTKKTVIVISIIASVAVLAIWGFSRWHNQQLDILREELLAEQAQTILEIQDLHNEETQSLRSKIEDLLMEEEVVFDAAPIKEQILNIGELGTQEYQYTEVGTIDSVIHFANTNLEIPFSSKTVIMTMDGILKAGIDVAKIEIKTNEATKTITVIIPEAKVLSNELLEETLNVLIEEEGLFNEITLEDSNNLRIELKNKAQQKALDKGLLEKAREEAGSYVKSLIEAVPAIKDTYTIIVR